MLQVSRIPISIEKMELVLNMIQLDMVQEEVLAAMPEGLCYNAP